MFECTLTQGKVFKMLIEAIRELITEGNVDCSKSGLSMQAMDSSHVSLIALLLRAEGFEHFRCDRNISLGLQLASLSKILKCSGNDDSLQLSAGDSGDMLDIVFDSASGNRAVGFQLKLMDIDSEHLAIPLTEYVATVRLPSSEFQRICRDLHTIGDTCTIGVSKEGVKFGVTGDLGSGNIMLKSDQNAEKEDDRIIIQMEEPVQLTFALRYLNNFTKATALSPVVSLSISPGVPIVVEYAIGELGYIRYFLAPKIDDEE